LQISTEANDVIPDTKFQLFLLLFFYVVVDVVVVVVFDVVVVAVVVHVKMLTCKYHLFFQISIEANDVILLFR
jgi:hypothetical protein